MRVSPIGTSGIRGLGLLFLATFMMAGRAEAQNQDSPFPLAAFPVSRAVSRALLVLPRSLRNAASESITATAFLAQGKRLSSARLSL